MTLSLDTLLLTLQPEPARYLAEIDHLLQSLGCQLDLRLVGSQPEQWRGSYYHARLGKTLLRIQVDASRRLGLRMVVDDLPRFLPHLLEEPWPLRKLVYSAAKCTDCGRCSSGPALLEDEDRIRKLCPVSFLTLSVEGPEHLDLLKRLLIAQAQLLSNDWDHHSLPARSNIEEP